MGIMSTLGVFPSIWSSPEPEPQPTIPEGFDQITSALKRQYKPLWEQSGWEEYNRRVASHFAADPPTYMEGMRKKSTKRCQYCGGKSAVDTLGDCRRCGGPQ